MGNDVWSEGFRQRLDLIKEERGISKAEMARLCGLPPRTLENYFKGHKPGIDALMALSRGLDVSVDWLLGDEDWHRTDHADIVSQAVWQAAREYLCDMVRDTSSGKPVIDQGKIYGSEPEALQCASRTTLPKSIAPCSRSTIPGSRTRPHGRKWLNPRHLAQ